MKIESLKFFRMLLLLLLMMVAIFICKDKLVNFGMTIMAVVVLFVFVLSFLIKIVKYKKFKCNIEFQFGKFYNNVALKHPKIKLLSSKFKNKLFLAYKKRYNIKTFFKFAELMLFLIIILAIFVVIACKLFYF